MIFYSLQIKAERLHLDRREGMTAIAVEAIALFDRGEIDEAIVMMKGVVNRQSKLFGKDHPDTLVNVDQLASLYSHAGLWGEAKETYERLLSTKTALLGSDHLDTITVAFHLGGLLTQMAEYHDALVHLERVLNIRSDALGKEHEDTLKTMYSIAIVYMEQNNFKEAKDILDLLLDSYESIFGLNHLATLRVLCRVATLVKLHGTIRQQEIFVKSYPILSEQNDLIEKIIDLYKNQWKFKQKYFGPEHIVTIRTLDYLCILLEYQGRIDERKQLQAYLNVSTQELSDSRNKKTESSPQLKSNENFKGSPVLENKSNEAEEGADSPVSDKEAQELHENKFKKELDQKIASDAIENANIFRATELGNVHRVRFLIEVEGTSVDAKDSSGSTALIWAARYNKVEIAQLLMRKKANVNIANNWGRTALMWAAFNGNGVMVFFLLQYGANIGLVDNQGQTAEDLAIEQNHLDIVSKLGNTRASSKSVSIKNLFIHTDLTFPLSLYRHLFILLQIHVKIILFRLDRQVLLRCYLPLGLQL